MEHTKWLFPVRNDRNERQSKMNPRAWVLKVLIVRMELQQKDPTVVVRSLPPDNIHRQMWSVRRAALLDIIRSTGDRLPLACEIAVLDAMALISVVWRVHEDDGLREVLARAARSIRKAPRHAGIFYEHFSDWYLFKFEQAKLCAWIASKPGSTQKYADASESDAELAIAYTLHAFLTSVLHLLTFVFQYLIGYVDRGGSKTYSSGAFDFRASFVALVLFQGAYVWIKFRQAATPDCRKRKAPDVVDIEEYNLKGLHKRSIKNASGDFVRFKYEPRFKRLALGEYHTPAEAQIVLQIARYCYDEDGGCVELKDGPCKFPIPPVNEQERGLAGEAKRKWVTSTAKQVGKRMYADFQREKGKQLGMATEAGSHGAECNDPPSSSALPLACPPRPVVSAMAAERAIVSAAPPSPTLPLLPLDGAIVGGADCFSETLSGCEDMIAELLHGPGLPNPPDPQSSVVSYQMQYQEFAQLLGDPSLPEIGAAAEGIEHDSEPILNPSPSFQQGRVLAVAGTENMDGRVFLPQSDPDLQQLLLCQKKCLEDNARHFVDLDHQLKACQIQNIRLQQEKEQWQREKEQWQREKEQWQREKEQLQQENESLKSRLQQVAKSQVATWTGIMIEMQPRD